MRKYEKGSQKGAPHRRYLIHSTVFSDRANRSVGGLD